MCSKKSTIRVTRLMFEKLIVGLASGYKILEDKGVKVIINALLESALSLKVVEMAKSDITVETVYILAACIVAKQCLAKLSLVENKLKDECVVLIRKVLEEGHN